MADLASELRKIYAERGDVQPETVVAVAADPVHPLHDRFEWDDEVAGHRHRLDQAGQMIRSVKVRFTDRQGERRKIHEWHSVIRSEGRAYQPLDEIEEDPVAMEILLREAKAEMNAMVRRYGHLDEFWAMIREGLRPLGDER